MAEKGLNTTIPNYRGKDIKLKLAFLMERGYRYDTELGQWINDSLPDKHFRFISDEMIISGKFELFTKAVIKNETDELMFFSEEEIA